jgi:hypothetical protein
MAGLLSINEFLARIEGAGHHLHEHQMETLERIGEKVKADAKSYFGNYQQGAGRFETWKPLAQATLDDKQKKGLPSPSPLLRTGEARDSIEFKVTSEPYNVTIGSDDDRVLWQELGTPNAKHPIPPRSTLAIALVRNIEYAKNEFGVMAVNTLFY